MDIYRKDGEDTTWIYEGRIGKIPHEYIKDRKDRTWMYEERIEKIQHGYMKEE